MTISKNEQKVSRRNIDRLLRELGPDRYRQNSCELKEADQKVEDFTNTLLAHPKLKALVKRAEQIRDREAKRHDSFRERVRAVRRLYWAKGPTPQIMATLIRLVEEENSMNEKKINNHP
jgi:hypothetical protein